MTHDLPWLEAELAAQSDWVRRLARSLVHDEAAAEDLVQDTWLAALRRPPSDRNALRGWLARVVRRLAWKQHGRRASEPHGAELGEHAAGASESEFVEKLELHGLLVEELRQLREPLRSTLVERYFEDRSAAEIAQRTGVPAPTVRGRIQQGLEDLRARLDARCGGNRDTWMSALAFALPRKGVLAGGSAAVIGEGVLMSTLSKISLGAAVLVAAVLLARPLLTKEVPRTPALAEAPPAKPDQPEAQQPVRAEEPASARATLAEDTRPVAVEPAPPDAEHVRIVARLVDAERRPIPGAWLSVGQGMFFEVMNARPQPPPAKPDEERALADSDGDVRIERRAVRGAESLTLTAGAPGFACSSLHAVVSGGTTTHLGEVVLEAAGGVRGRVLDENGAPLAGIQVAALRARSVQRAAAESSSTVVLQPERGGELTLPAISGPDGAFTLEGVAPGVVRIWGRIEGNRWAHAGPLQLEAGKTLEGVEVVAPRPPPAQGSRFTLRGVVLQPDGTPLGGASLSVSSGGPGGSVRERSGADGRFELVTSTRGPFFLQCSCEPSKHKYRPLQRRGVMVGDEDLELRFAEPRWMELEILADGKPAAQFVVFTTQGERRTGEPLEHEAGAPANVGKIMLPDTEFGLRVEADGFVAAEAGPFAPASVPAALRLELHATAAVAGRVLAAGKPVPGADVRLVRELEVGEGYVDGFATLYEVMDAIPTRSDADGAFRAGISTSGRYHVCVRAAGFALADAGPFVLDASRGLDGVEVELDQGGALEGAVLVPPGRSPSGVIVSLNRGDGEGRTQRVGPDGRFRFEQLTSGRWVLARSDHEFDENRSTTFGRSPESKVALPFNCTVERGATTRQDLDLRDEKPCMLVGRLSIAGAPAWAWSVRRATRAGRKIYSGPPMSADLDSAGKFALEVECPGEWTLELSAPPESAGWMRVQVPLTLAAGRNDWSYDLAAGRVTGKLSAPRDASLGVRCTPAGLGECTVACQISGTSTFVLPVVPAGSCELLEYRQGQREPTVLARFTLAAGETKTVEIP